MGDFDPTWIAVSVTLLAFLCGAGIWIGSVNADRKSFKAFMAEVRDKLDNILSRLPPPRGVAPGSPLQLTPFGERLFKEIEASVIATKLLGELRDKITEEMTNYDVQQMCFDYVKLEWEPPRETELAIKETAYQNGTDIETVQDVIALEAFSLLSMDAVEQERSAPDLQSEQSSSHISESDS
ncbi:hypothetical protein [Ruegeria sp.]|uniref:hypothetical protein n=1 Tax=Ruegeria sp. TaxID=1879320 RepID=UPI003B0070AF